MLESKKVAFKVFCFQLPPNLRTGRGGTDLLYSEDAKDLCDVVGRVAKNRELLVAVSNRNIFYMLGKARQSTLIT